MSDYSTWWEGLNLSLKIYWGIAIPFTLFFALQLIWSFFGGSDVPDDTPDAEVAADHGFGSQFMSAKNLITFLTIFGWAGIAAIDAGASETWAAIIATAAGLVMVLIMATIYYFMARANHDGTMKFEKAIGHSGEVYLVIPSKRSGIGKVQIKVQKSLRTLEAVTDDETNIPTGALVKVTAILNENLLLVTAK